MPFLTDCETCVHNQEKLKIHNNTKLDSVTNCMNVMTATGRDVRSNVAGYLEEALYIRESTFQIINTVCTVNVMCMWSPCMYKLNSMYESWSKVSLV